MVAGVKPFTDVTRRTQIERMRRAAREALRRHYGLTDVTLRLLIHDFNTTFRVDTDSGDRFAMRMGLNSTKAAEEVLGEVEWVSAIHEETDVLVPTPVRTGRGDFVVASEVAGRAPTAPTVLYSWLDGPDVSESVRVKDATAMGALMASLHRHGRSWQPPTTARYRNIASVMMDSSDVLTGRHAPWLDDTASSTLAAARSQVERILQPVFAGPRHLIHGDVHMWNVKRVDGRLAVFDFDDCGFGVPIQDLGISAYYFGDDPRMRAALLEGYAHVLPVPEHTPEQFEALIAGRNLLLLNDVADSVTAGHDDLVTRYADRTVRRLRRYLDTGVFRFEVET